MIELPDQTLLAHIHVQDDSAPGKDHYFTIYYGKKENSEEKCSTRYTRWRIAKEYPERNKAPAC